MGWQTVPALVLIVGIFGGGMVLRTTVQDAYYDKPKPVDPDYFTKAMMLRDRMLAEADKAKSGGCRALAAAAAPRAGRHAVPSAAMPQCRALRSDEPSVAPAGSS